MTSLKFDEEAVFKVARRLPAGEARGAYLDQVCGGDAALRARVEDLLRVDEEERSFLAAPAVGPAETIDAPRTEGPGAQIGPYKLLEQIGEGGFGVVYLAEQQEPVRRKVALKVLKAGMDTRQVVARFEAERQALAIMDHPNIAKVLDGGVTAGGRPYFVMELVRGVPITEFCDANHMTPRQRLELFLSVCHAVQHAHQKGVIHRDLKPSNVLVSRHDTTPTVKVIDFGVAKAVGQELTDKTLFTGLAQMVGTPLYMSPEQAGMSDLDVDTRSDIYSLGVLLYELLTGTTPFAKERFKQAAYDEIRRIIREEEPPRPSTRLSESTETLPSISAQRQTEPAKLSKLVRGELDWIVMKALEKDRGRRYETANGFAQDIERYLADEPVLACPPSARYRLRKFARRHKTGVAVAALILFFLASLGGVAGWAAKDRADRRLEAALQQEAQRSALETDIARDLEATRDLCRQDRLREASTVLDHAQALVARGGVGDELGRRVGQMRTDVDMATRLEAIRLGMAAVKDERFDREGTARRYTEAFRDYGVDVDNLDAEEAAARVQGSEIREQLIAALDFWLVSTPKGDRKRLADVSVRADADPWRQQVRAAFAAGDLKALRVLADKASAAGQPPSAAVLLGKALHDLGNITVAVEFLRLAHQEHPGDFWLNQDLGSYLVELGSANAGKAVGYLRAALALRPDSPGVLTNLGTALYVQDDLPGAVAAFQKAVTLKPDIAFAHRLLGRALRAQGDLPGAIAAYQKAIALRPIYPEDQVALGEILEDHGDLPGAVAAYQKAIALKPDLAKKLRPDVVTARYHVRRSQWDEAAAEYAKADFWTRPLREDAFTYAGLFLIRGDGEGYDRFCQGMIERAAPADAPPEAYILARSCAIARDGRVDPARAVRWASQAVASDRRAAWYVHVLGLAQYRAGQLDQALQSLTQAQVKTWMGWELNWFGLALVHHGLGRADEARRCLDRGIQWLERERPPSPGRPAKLLPQDWVEAQLLRREAEELLEKASAKKKD